MRFQDVAIFGFGAVQAGDLPFKLEYLRDFFKSRGLICFFSAAGISTISGVLDFRSRRDAKSNARMIGYQEFLTHKEAYREDWRHRFDMAAIVKKIKVNVAHQWIAQMVTSSKAVEIMLRKIDYLKHKSKLTHVYIIHLRGIGFNIHRLIWGRNIQILQ